MASVVITLIGDDRAGLVDAVAGVVARHGGNWDRSHLAELAGKFAGIVLVDIAETSVEPLLASLEELDADGLLAITAELAEAEIETDNATTQVALELTGADHPGIVHQISRALAELHVSIDELETAVVPAPQGGHLFIANAVLELPRAVEIEAVRSALEAVAADLMVDLELG